MRNSFEGFKKYCGEHNVDLTSDQEGAARQFFAIEQAGGKTTMLAYMALYDSSFKEVFCEVGKDARRKFTKNQLPQPPDPPPCRQMRDTVFFGLIETKESKQKTRDWYQKHKRDRNESANY